MLQRRGFAPSASSWKKMITFALLIFLAAGSRALADEYYAIDQGAATYIAWTQDASGRLQGQIEFVALTPGATTMKVGAGAIHGVRSGSDVTIVVEGIFGGETITGSLRSGVLTLVVPTTNGPEQVVLHSGTFAQFRKAELAFRTGAQSNNYHAQLADAVAEAQRHIVAGENDITQGYGTIQWVAAHQSLGELGQKYRSLLGDLHSKVAITQDAAVVDPMTCSQKAQVASAAGDVHFAYGGIAFLDAQVNSDFFQFRDAVQQIGNGIKEIEMWTTVYDQRQQAYQAAIGSSYHGKAIAPLRQLVANARASIKQVTSLVASSKTALEGYDRQAKDDDESAQSLADSVTCSDN